ncbi:MAG: glycosyl transferase family [Mucilaginibacter sp.]|uniref:glycosyltransferase n=1 Tax=Mucilaginibacter sp. TaxID=1882438 RepID=UPI002609248A|nr:glycosyltransferase [Mucilaginibacter sp.]MDB5001956.1 glycosyl transferase family [Mucilaginibacter sp.]
MDERVSIIIALFNAENYINETILSVINQSYTNWELIIIDDGSTDGSAHIIQQHLIDNRIQYFKKYNTGVSDSRNFGANIATGIFLCFLDADDLFHYNNIKEKLDFLMSNPEYPLVHADVELIDENSNSTGGYFKGKGGNILNSLLLWQETNIPGPSSTMMTKNIFYNIGQWDVAFSTAADQELFFRVAAKHPIGHINKVLTSYRVLPNSMSRNISIMEKDHVSVYKKAYKNGLFKSFWFKQQCFSNLYFTLAGSWWINGKNKKRGIYFLIKALFIYPPVLVKLTKKVISK